MSSEQKPNRIVHIPVAVVTAREPVTGNQWIDERWKVAAVVTDREDTRAGITRSLMSMGPEGERYLWTGFTLRLHPSEADAYYYNIIGQSPKLYVYCEYDDSGEPRPRSVTAEYIDALSHLETDNAAFAVPMPRDLYHALDRFVREHYVPEEPKLRRKRDRARRAEHWQDE